MFIMLRWNQLPSDDMPSMQHTHNSRGSSVSIANLCLKATLLKPKGDWICLIDRYDANVEYIIQKIIGRLEAEIEVYRIQIMNGKPDDQTVDIVFGNVYQSLIKRCGSQDLITLLLHADGVSVTNSSKLKMWLLSAVIVEIPPNLRSRRCNMIPISIWVSTVEPVMNIWLKRSIDNLQSIKATGMNYIFRHRQFFAGKVRSVGSSLADESYLMIWWGVMWIDCERKCVERSIDTLLFHLISFQGVPMIGRTLKLNVLALTGDCPAISLLLNFINHNGHYSCWFCFIDSVYVSRKRQFPHQQVVLRTNDDYRRLSKKGEKSNKHVFGHFGRSIITELLDTPLPNGIIPDYLHVTLLGHSKNLVLSIYHRMRPQERKEFNDRLVHQKFPRMLSSTSPLNFHAKTAFLTTVVFLFRFLQSQDSINGEFCFYQRNGSSKSSLLWLITESRSDFIAGSICSSGNVRLWHSFVA